MQAGPPPHEWAPGNVPRLAGPADRDCRQGEGRGGSARAMAAPSSAREFIPSLR